MTIIGDLRLDVAREQARHLEDAIRETRESYSDADPQVVAALLEPVIAELQAIRAQIDRALGLELARQGAASLWLRFRGRNVGDGRGPIQMVGKVLAALQRGARQASGFLELGVAAPRRLADDLLLATELDVLAFGTGSLRVAIAPRIEQLSLTEEGVLAERGLSLVMQVAQWAQANDEDGALDRLLPNPQVRRQLINRVRDIAPGPRADFEVLELSGPTVESHGTGLLVLSQQAYTHASSYLRRRTREPVSYSGKLVMVDVEKDIFDLRIMDQRIHCHFDEAVRQQAKDLVEHFVEVRGLGLFELEDDNPYRIDVESIRQLQMDEIAALERLA